MSFEAIRARLTAGVPFAEHCGVSLDKLDRGSATATLPFRQAGLNHIGTQHAGALFAVGEAASGAAMAGLFADVLGRVRPVAGEATGGEPEGLLRSLRDEGRVAFPVTVELLDSESGEKLAEMTVRWHVTDISKPKEAR
jgi:acyl-coenzyme A thioesterase PaaI-like protein